MNRFWEKQTDWRTDGTESIRPHKLWVQQGREMKIWRRTKQRNQAKSLNAFQLRMKNKLILFQFGQQSVYQEFPIKGTLWTSGKFKANIITFSNYSSSEWMSRLVNGCWIDRMCRSTQGYRGTAICVYVRVMTYLKYTTTCYTAFSAEK